MDPNLETLLSLLRAGIAAHPNVREFGLPELARPAARLLTQRVEQSQLGLGASRLGGQPDVPPGFEWPYWTPLEQRPEQLMPPRPASAAPLGFIAQIDLSSIPHFDEVLPPAGWLYFFYDRYWEPWGFDPADRGCSRVLFYEGDRSQLSTAEPPDDLPAEHRAEPSAVQARLELTLPGDLPQLKYGTPAYQSYHAICEQLEAEEGRGCHRLLGHSREVQNAMELECQLVTNGIYCGGADGWESEEARRLAPGADQWRLLLQIDTDEEGPGWMWGDVGMIYFWIKQQDLTARRFDDCWLILQCS